MNPLNRTLTSWQSSMVRGDYQYRYEFVVDPAWPQPLPNNWLLGQVGGLFVDSHDNIWVHNRPRTMTTEESGLEDAAPGAKNAQGQPINGPGFPRPHGPVADCCKAAPSVLEFDASGKLLRSWGCPADPEFIGGKCKEAAGCIWPNSEHGIYVDQNDNVWIAGNAGASGVAPAENGAPEGADEAGSPTAASRSGRGVVDRGNGAGEAAALRLPGAPTRRAATVSSSSST